MKRNLSFCFLINVFVEYENIQKKIAELFLLDLKLWKGMMLFMLFHYDMLNSQIICNRKISVKEKKLNWLASAQNNILKVYA